MFSKHYVRKSIFNLGEYLIALSLILHGRTIWSVIPSMSEIFTYVNLLMLVIGVLLCLFSKRTLYIKNCTHCLALIALVALYFIFYILITNYNHLSVIRTMIACCILFVYVNLCRSDKEPLSVLVKYKNLIAVVVVISLFFWLFGSQLNVIKPNVHVYSSWSKSYVSGYFGIYFEPQYVEAIFFDGFILRNCAIFAEAPMCAFQFGVALLIEVFLCKKPSNILFVIYTLGLLTTVSTMGYVIVIGVVVMRFLMFKPKKQAGKIIKSLVVLLSVVFGFVAAYLVFSKLDSSSGNIRMDDFMAGYLAWQDNVLFGNGFNNIDAIIKHMSSWRITEQGFSNSIFQILSDGGLYLASFYIVSFVRGLYFARIYRNLKSFIFIIFFMFMFVITIVSYTNITFCILILMLKGNLSYKENVKTAKTASL